MRNLKLVAISLFILTVVFLQSVTASRAYLFRVGPYQGDPDLWPFLSYPMYRAAHYPGDSIDRYRLVGVTESGETRLTPRVLGISYWIWLKEIVTPLELERTVEFDVFKRRYEERAGEPLLEIRLENNPLVLERDGVEEAEPRTVRTVRVDGTAETP